MKDNYKDSNSSLATSFTSLFINGMKIKDLCSCFKTFPSILLGTTMIIFCFQVKVYVLSHPLYVACTSNCYGHPRTCHASISTTSQRISTLHVFPRDNHGLHRSIILILRPLLIQPKLYEMGCGSIFSLRGASSIS